MRATRLLVYIPAPQGVFSVPVTGPRDSLSLPNYLAILSSYQTRASANIGHHACFKPIFT